MFIDCEGLQEIETKYDLQSDPKSKTSKLHVAVLNEDIEKVRKYVQGQFEDEGSRGSLFKDFRSKAGDSKHPNINTLDSRKRSPLHLCATTGNDSIFWQLLSHGANIGLQDDQGATALHRSVDAGNDDISRMILDRKGCPIDGTDLDLDTPLHVAVRRSNKEMAAVLLRKGANADLKNRQGEAPLHESIRHGNVPMAQLLLRGGASVNLPGPRGLTPLMMAASSLTSGMPNLVDTFLSYEADPDATDDRGYTALRYAKEFCQEETAKILEQFMHEQSRRQQVQNPFDFEDEEDRLPPLGPGVRGEEATVIYDTPAVDATTNDQYALPVPQGLPQEGVAPEDLSDWDSTASEVSQKPGPMKHSVGMMDLSKVLSRDSEESVSPDKSLHSKPSGHQIYDTVDNLAEPEVEEPQYDKIPALQHSKLSNLFLLKYLSL